MSTLGAHVASTLGAFRATTLGARGAGEEAVGQFRYIIAIGSNVYYYRPENDSWQSMGGNSGTVRSLHWHNGELWSGTDQSPSLQTAIYRHNANRSTGVQFFGPPDSCTDFYSDGPNLLCWAIESITPGTAIPGIYDLSADEFFIDSGAFDDFGAAISSLGGFADSGITTYAFHGPPFSALINSRVPSTNWPIVAPVNSFDPPPATIPTGADIGRRAVYNGSKFIIAGWGEPDGGANPNITTRGSTLFEFTGTAASVQAIDGTLVGSQHRWQTSATFSALDTDGLGTTLSAGAEFDGASRTEGLLETDGATISKPLTCTAGEITGVSKEADGRVFLGGTFTDFDENPTTGPPIPMNRLAFYNTVSGLPELWLNSQPPAGSISQTLVIPFGDGPTIDPIPDQEAPLGGLYTFTCTGANVLTWRMVNPTTPEIPPIDAATGVITWDPVPAPFGLPYHIMTVYAGDATWWSTETWLLWTATAITMPVLGTDTGNANGDFYSSSTFTLTTGSGNIEYSISATDLPDPGAASISVINTARTQFRLVIAPEPPAGTHFVTIRATNTLGFDENTITIDFI